MPEASECKSSSFYFSSSSCMVFGGSNGMGLYGRAWRSMDGKDEWNIYGCINMYHCVELF